jgi:hypothetical protein
MMALPRLVSASDESGVLCVYDDNSKPKLKRRSYAREVLDVFLPAGYPHTVTADYTPYQIYVSCDLSTGSTTVVIGQSDLQFMA